MLQGKNKQLFLIVRENGKNMLPLSSIMLSFQQHKSSFLWEEVAACQSALTEV